jgi:hypothetical protein
MKIIIYHKEVEIFWQDQSTDTRLILWVAVYVVCFIFCLRKIGYRNKRIPWIINAIFREK